MTDYHTHILPGIDDGCQTVEESVAVLNMLKEQGVTRVYATSHYYSGQNSPEVFLRRRESAYQKLKPYLTPDMPEVLLGAEIEYFDGMRRIKGIYDLALEGTRILLIEMPEERWSYRTVSEILEINGNSGYTVMIAHVDRYAFYQKKNTLKALVSEGVIMQGSADFFALPQTRNKALKMFKKNEIHVLGTDAHDPVSRPPRMKQAADVIAKRFGDDVLEDLSV